MFGLTHKEKHKIKKKLARQMRPRPGKQEAMKKQYQQLAEKKEREEREEREWQEKKRRMQEEKEKAEADRLEEEERVKAKKLEEEAKRNSKEEKERRRKEEEELEKKKVAEIRLRQMKEKQRIKELVSDQVSHEVKNAKRDLAIKYKLYYDEKIRREKEKLREKYEPEELHLLGREYLEKQWEEQEKKSSLLKRIQAIRGDLPSTSHPYDPAAELEEYHRSQVIEHTLEPADEEPVSSTTLEPKVISTLSTPQDTLVSPLSDLTPKPIADYPFLELTNFSEEVALIPLPEEVTSPTSETFDQLQQDLQDHIDSTDAQVPELFQDVVLPSEEDQSLF